MVDKDSLMAKGRYESLNFILSVYEKSIGNVVALIGDIKNTNGAIARQVGPFFVGCHLHHPNHAVNDIHANFDTILDNVHHVM